jgi:hypothetical protein
MFRDLLQVDTEDKRMAKIRQHAMNASQKLLLLIPLQSVFQDCVYFFDSCFYYNVTMLPAFPVEGLPLIILVAQNIITKIYDEIIIL